MKIKLSDYMTNTDWFSFIQNSIVNCPHKEYANYLKAYFENSQKYNIHFNLSHALDAFQLIIDKKATQDLVENEMGSKESGLTLVCLSAASPSHAWRNGTAFLTALFEHYPHIAQEFIQEPSFMAKSTLIIKNHNAYISRGNIEKESFITFLNTMFTHMNKEQFSQFYQKNEMYLNENHTPKLCVFMDKTYLEFNMAKHDDIEQSNAKKFKV